MIFGDRKGTKCPKEQSQALNGLRLFFAQFFWIWV